MNVHELKITPKYFDLVVKDIKKFEVRFCDRDYKVGDELLLKEFNNGEYTGRTIVKRIVYILDDIDYVKEGYAILGF